MRQAKKFLDLEFTVVAQKDASQECIIEGYANTTTKDRVGDIVLPKAFESSIKGYLDNPVLLENHNWDRVAGMTQTAEITDKGLFIRARISDTRPELKQQIREGCLRTFSIGYNELDADFDETTKTKFVKDLELLEISVVSVPANPEAKFVEISSNNPVPAPKDEPTPVMSVEPVKAAPLPQVTKSAEQLRQLFNDVTSVCGDLSSENILNLCDYFNSEKEIMTKQELIEALKAQAKSLVVTTPESPAPVAKADPAPAETPAPSSPDDINKLLQALDQKLGMIADGISKLLEMEQAEADGESSESTDDGKTTPPPAAPAAEPCKKCGGEMAKDEAEGEMKCMKCGAKAEKSAEEIDADIAEIDAALAQLS
jgi:HK97 family phage prohead protease